MIKKQATFEQIQIILMERFAIDASKITLSVDLQKELNLDSMDALDLLLAVNEAFNIRIPEESLEKIHTIDQLVQLVDKKRLKSSLK